MKRSNWILGVAFTLAALAGDQAHGDCDQKANDVASLRSAITTATATDSTICLTSREYVFSNSHEKSGNALPTPTVDITLEGSPAATLRRSGDSQSMFRLIEHKEALTLKRLQVSDFSAPGSEHGGAISSKGSLTILSSTLNNNRASQGGAIHLNNVNATIRNSTLTDNGVAISSKGSKKLMVFHSTLAESSGLIHASNTDTANPGSVIFKSSILKGACEYSAVKGKSQGFNLLNDDSCVETRQGNDKNCSGSCGVSEKLFRNGGPTQTLALLTDSPALDAGDCDGEHAAEDQRGVSRKSGGVGEKTCSIGAYNALCSVDNVKDNILDIHIFLDFVHPTPSGTFTILNSGSCQISSIPEEATAVRWHVVPFKKTGPEAPARLRAFNIYFHSQCHAPDTGLDWSGCWPPLKVGQRPQDCRDCFRPSVFVSAQHESLGEIEVTKHTKDPILFYRITNLPRAEKTPSGIKAMCPSRLETPKSCGQSSAGRRKVGPGDSWWYTIQWSQDLNEGSWDPRMEGEIMDPDPNRIPPKP